MMACIVLVGRNGLPDENRPDAVECGKRADHGLIAAVAREHPVQIDGAAAFGQFLLYALGMGTVIMVLTLGMAFFKGAMVGGLRKALPYIGPVGSWLMVVAGAYIVFYWLTLGGLL